MKLKENQYFKAFDRNLQCRGFQYEEGREYRIDKPPVLCKRGFHFCKDLVLTLEYYPVNKSITENRYAVIEVIGDVVWEEPNKHKGVTNHVRIVKVLKDEEVLGIVDASYNSGHGNSGDRNSGHGNSGHGHSGDWNSCDHESGYFNSTIDDTVRVFGKRISREDWINAYKPSFLHFHIDPALGYKGSFKKSYEAASPEDRAKVKDLPGFDADIFFEISGIDLRNE